MTRTPQKPPIPSLEVRLFGGFEARVDDRPLPRLRSRRERWLLALLVLRQDRDTARDWLATTLWPDIEESQALFYLRKGLSNLRKALGGQAVRLLTPGPGTVRLDLTGAFVDSAAFDTAVAAGTVEDLERAVALYRGPLLEGCLEEWALPERAAREEAFYGALQRLASEALAHGQPATAAGALRRLIADSPLRESAYVALMEALAASGDAAGVREAYQDLRLLLHREMNAEPAAQTRALYERLQRASRQPALSQAQEPAPASLPSSPPRRLPVPLTRLIGRERNITEVVDRFTQGRLVTLTGSGGVGKTRLSIAVAEAVAAEFADGVWLVELASLADPDLAVGTVAKVFRVKERPGQTILETLTSALSSRSLLLVLDNCEHLLDGCALLVEELLRQCAGLRVLATSREALGVFGEWVYRVPSLEVPPLSECESGSAADKNLVPHLSEYAATTLFVERAAAQRSSLRLTVSEALGVAQICSRLDGIPLAIEMAAARVRTMSIEEIRSGLSDRFRLLRSGSRTSLPRHQALRALLDWSYNLLGDAEKVLLGRLSVFVGGWTAAAAEVVCSYEGEVDSPPSSFILPPCDVLDLLTSLMDKSLVEYQEREGKTRYRLSETVRQYGQDRLGESGEHDAVQARHRDCFLALSERAEPKLKGAEQVAWLHCLEAEHGNLRAALEWSMTEATSSAGLRFCGTLQMFWWMQGHLLEGRGWCARALEKADAQDRTSARAKAFNAAGLLARYQGDYAVALANHTASLAIYEEIEDRHGVATSYFNLGHVQRGKTFQDEVAKNRPYIEKSLTIRREIGDLYGIAASLGSLGIMAYCAGDETYGIDCQVESLTIRRKIGGLHGIAMSLTNLGHVYNEQGDYIKASACFEESRDIQETIGDRRGEALSLLNLGFMACDRHEPAIARAYFVKTLNIVSKLGEKRGIANCLGGFGSLAQLEDQWERVAVLGGMHEALSERIGLTYLPKEQEAVERLVAKLRKTLGEETFLDAWKQGRSMTMEQAIKYAMEELA